MYRHLLVPIDDSALSYQTATRAVGLARTIGAKVTFFHARTHHGEGRAGAPAQGMPPSKSSGSAADGARAILAKAEVAALEAGVACDSLTVTSDRPHEAILDAAEARGCDLIFMASHGRRGLKRLVLGSQTAKVLQHATIPVLVSAVEGHAATPAHVAATAIIDDEHHSLAAVIRGLEHVVREAGVDAAPPPFALLRAMLHYIKAFPETLHHPKEDAYLFRKLRARTPEFDDTLDELQLQHVAGNGQVGELEWTLAAWEADPAAGLPAFAAAVAQFAEAQWRHMNLERKVILPAAREHLTDEDWAEILRAFSENGDPRFNVGADGQFRRLFASILELAPAHVVGGADRGAG